MKRIGLKIAAGSALCLGLLGSSMTATGAASNSTWLQPQSDAAHSNRNNNETTITSATVAKLRVEYSLGRLPAYGPCGRPTEHASVATASTVYYFDGRRVIATDLTTGQTLWRSSDLGGVWGWEVTDIAVAGSRLILQGSNGCISQSDPGLFLFGLDITNGSQVWQAGQGGTNLSMVVSGNTLLSDNLEVGSGTPKIVAYDPATGARRWTRYGCGASSFAAAGGLFASTDNIMTTCGSISFAKAGKTNWTKPAGWTYLRADPSGTTSPNIYATNPLGKVTALSSTGAVKWTSAETGTVLAAGPSRLLVTCDSTSVCALNRTTGTRAWKSTRTVPATGAVLASDVAYITPATAPLSATTGFPIPEPDTDWLGPFTFLGSGSVQVAGGRLIHTTPRNVDIYDVSR